MNIEEYIIKIDDLTYVKDLITGRLLLVDSVESVTNIPSERTEKTLYVLNDTVHYYSNFEVAQVELEKQKVNKSAVKEASVKKELNTKVENDNKAIK